jgi:hypothetical protein
MTIVISGYDVLIDDEDYERYKGHKWIIRLSRKTIPYVGYYEKEIKRVIELQRFIMNNPKGLFVDHINGNPLDNRKCNLRICTPMQNCHNQKKRTTNTSGYKGVSPAKNGRWRATIRGNGERIHLGYFRDPALAHAAYCEASKKYHGEYGRTE